jgi:hypothetical protein
MKEQFREIKYQKKSLFLIERVNNILEEYKKQGIKVTLRQVYYQLVARDIIQNKDSEYRKLSSLLTNARYSGIIDWNAIEDRTRIPNIPNTFENIEHLLRVASENYQLNKWEKQDYYIELWTEKDAISSVIYPITQQYQVTLVVNRGYSSASSMYVSSQRFFQNRIKANEFSGLKRSILLYLGDFDPSGLDMDRDIKTRFEEFGVEVEVLRIGLTQEQISKYKLPRNPAKISDVRAKEFISKYGVNSYEVDALRPEVLQELIQSSILNYLKVEEFELVRKQEQQDLKKLQRIALK